jgi:hypothetical protein
MNFALVCHVSFELDPKEHLDALFVAIVGMSFSIVCAFLCLLHSVVVDRSNSARYWVSFITLYRKFLVVQVLSICCD